MAPSGLAWTTSDPKRTKGPVTHADLACGIGGFTVAAQALGATTNWACDINRTAVDAYNAARSHALARPAECHPIELMTRWSRHGGADIISASFPCQAFSRVGLRQGYRDARGQFIFHLIQMCWVPRPKFMVLECVWPSSRTPSGLSPCATTSAAWATGSPSRKNKPPTTWPRSAPGVSSRLLGPITGAKPWGRCDPSSRVRPPPSRAMVRSANVLGPHPPWGSPLYLLEDQAMPVGGSSQALLPRQESQELMALEGIHQNAQG